MWEFSSYLSMSQELIREIENLIEFGYGDTNRLDSIVNALENGHSLHQSDQTYVDMLISKCLYPHMEENWNVKKRVGSLDQKIQNVKRDYRNKSEAEINKEISVNFCSKCGSTVSRMYASCEKCGTLHDEYNFGKPRKEKPKQKRHAEPITEERGLFINHCRKCGLALSKTTEFCPNCGTYQTSFGYRGATTYKSEGTSLVLSLLFGAFGFLGIAHRYIGNIGRSLALLYSGWILIFLSLVGLSPLINEYIEKSLYPQYADYYGSFGAVVNPWGMNYQQSEVFYITFLIVIPIAYFVLFIWQIFDARNQTRKFNDFMDKSGSQLYEMTIGKKIAYVLAFFAPVFAVIALALVGYVLQNLKH